MIQTSIEALGAYHSDFRFVDKGNRVLVRMFRCHHAVMRRRKPYAITAIFGTVASRATAPFTGFLEMFLTHAKTRNPGVMLSEY